MPFAGIPGLHPPVQAGESLERPVEKLQAERRQLIADYRELLATDEERGAYDQMITLAHRVFPYVEGHKFYCEHWYTNLFFNKIREFGALARAATDSSRDAEDVFQLTHFELESAIIDLMTSWSTGSAPRGPTHWPAKVAERRAAIKEWAQQDTAPALGPVPDIIDDPAIVMLWGITRESLDTWLKAGQAATPTRSRGFAASQRRGRRAGARGAQRRGNLAAAARRHSRVPDHQSRPGRLSSRRSPARCPTSAAR